MLKDSTAPRSDGPWSSALHIVPKKDKGWRLCGDYRSLNARTISDPYAVRHIHDYSQHLAGCTVFSTIDLVRAPGTPRRCGEDSHHDAIRVVRISFHVFWAAQRRANIPAIHGRNPEGIRFLFCIRRRHPSILTFSRGTQASPPDPLRQLQSFGILLNPNKCVFHAKEVTFLGFRISNKGSQPLPDRVADLQANPLPQTIRQLRSFLGMLNFYRRLLPAAAATQASLHALLAGPRIKQSQNINWTPALSQSFEEYKGSLSRAAMPAHPDDTIPIALATDASTTAIGAVLQREQGAWKPLAIFSKKVNTAKEMYSAYD